jgi:hypothetical protein
VTAALAAGRELADVPLGELRAIEDLGCQGHEMTTDRLRLAPFSQAMKGAMQSHVSAPRR